MSNSIGLAPLKTSEYERLLRAWGFTKIEHGGNHPMFLAPDGKTRFPMSTPGKVTQRELRQAARVCGVSRRQFLQGPPKKRPMRAGYGWNGVMAAAKEVTDPIEELVAVAEQRAKENQVAKVIDEKRPYNKGVKDRVRELLSSHPGEVFAVRDIQRAVDSDPNSGAVHQVLSKWAEEEPRLKKVSPGKWMLDGDGVAAAAVVALDRVERPVRSRDGGVSKRTIEYVMANPHRPLVLGEVAKAVGSSIGSVSTPLRKLAEDLEGMKRLSRGVYVYEPPVEEPSFVADETPEVSAHPAMEAEPALAAPLAPVVRLSGTISAPIATMWEQMQDLGEDRYLLRDENGKLWVAKMQELSI